MRIEFDGLKNIVFIDESSPTFIWTVDKSKKMKGFKVTCGDLNSGYVEGERNQYIFSKPVFNKPLDDYIAILTIYYENNIEYKYTKKIRTGLMGNNNQAKWIWYSNKKIIGDFSTFKKEFVLDKRVKAAYLHVSSHNHHILKLNDIRVGGYISPAHSDPIKKKYYLMYEVSDLIKIGTNKIKALCHYIGGNGQNYVDGEPGFFMYLKIYYEDGENQEIYTDNRWEASYIDKYEKNTEFMQNRRISVIERYDSNKKRLFKTGVEVKRNYNLKLQYLPEEEIDSVIKPKLISNKNGKKVYDVGRIVAGFPKIKASGKKHEIVRIRYSEDLDEKGNVKHNVCNEESSTYFDEYILKGSKQEIFIPEFSIKAFRYLEVETDAFIEELLVLLVYTSLDYKGEFISSSNLINKIYEASINTQKNALHGQIVDCPHREQAQYLADACLQGATLLYNFDSYEIIDKVLDDFKNAQFEDGTFPVVYPTNIRNDIMGNLHIPEWDLHFVLLLYDFYNYFGEDQILSKYYKTAKKMLDYYIDKIDIDGLLPKSNNWHISDWPYPKISHDYKYLTVQNCKLYHCMKLMGCYEEEAYNLRQAIRKKLFLPDEGVFLDKSQGANVAAYAYGLVNEEEKQDLLDYIISKGHETSILLSYNLLRILFENEKEEEAYKILASKKYHSWGYMIKNGYETLWEGFDNIESHSHAWSTYPARIFQEYILGVKPLKKGFETTLIDGYLPKELENAKGRVLTPNGTIEVKKARNHIKVKLFKDMKVLVMVNKETNEIYKKGTYEWEL